MILATKIQYNNFEPGEFTDQKDSTYEETIAIIEHFPWEAQRDHLQIGLTNPSVTIESLQGSLKLAVYYGGKFVLHYFNAEKQLYTKSFTNYTDSYPYIKAFFDTDPFDPQGFKKEITWGLHPSLHFEEQDFHYTLHFSNYGSSLLLAGILFFISFLMLAALLNPHNTMEGRVPLGILFSILFFTVIYLLAQLLNHYKYCRGKVLILSKGHDLFYFGNEEKPQEFNKTNILDIVTYGTKGRGNTYDGYLVDVEINFKDGSRINISTMLIRHSVLLGKFAGHTIIDERKILPFIAPSSSIPS